MVDLVALYARLRAASQLAPSVGLAGGGSLTVLIVFFFGFLLLTVGMVFWIGAWFWVHNGNGVFVYVHFRVYRGEAGFTHRLWVGLCAFG